MAAVRRNRIPYEKRQRIVQAFENPQEDYLAVADTLGVNRSTARGIVAKFVEEGRVAERPRGGAHNVKIDEEMKQCLSEIIDENCQLTLRAINEELRRRQPAKPEVNDRTVGKTLNGMLVSVKLSRILPADRNRPDVLQQRFDYATWFMNEGVVNRCIFVDECGYNIWTARSCGRARVGERAYRQVCGQRGRNVTICLAVSSIEGLVHYRTMQGGMNRERFAEFLNELAEHVDENELTYVIYDGAPAHRNAESPSDFIYLKQLPPYSPFLNIVEQAISSLKAAVKADLSRPNMQAEMNNRIAARQQGIPLGEYRHQLLVAASERNMGTITVQKCAAWYRFMQTYLPRCLNHELIEG